MAGGRSGLANSRPAGGTDRTTAAAHRISTRTSLVLDVNGETGMIWRPQAADTTSFQYRERRKAKGESRAVAGRRGCLAAVVMGFMFVRAFATTFPIHAAKGERSGCSEEAASRLMKGGDPPDAMFDRMEPLEQPIAEGSRSALRTGDRTESVTGSDA